MRLVTAVALLVLASTGLAQPPGPFGRPPGNGQIGQPNGLGGFGQPNGKNPFGQGSPPEKVRWEYAEMYYRFVQAPLDGDHNAPPTLTIQWATGKEELQAASWAAFAEKLKLPGLKKDGSQAFQRMQVLDHLGGEGWELVEVAGSNTNLSTEGARFGSNSRTMLFKRRVR